MILAWYDPTNHHVSTDKNDPLFTPLGQLWPLHKVTSPLTDEEIIETCDTWVVDDIGSDEVIKIVRRTELAHGIGENDE